MSDIDPGWYADPKNPAGFRWWDGNAWTDDTYDHSSEAMAATSSSEATIEFEGEDNINYADSPSSYRAIFFIVVFLVIAVMLFIAVSV